MAGTPSSDKTLGIVSTNPGDRGLPSHFVDSNGKYSTVALDSSGNVPVVATITPSGTQDVNITKVGGNAVTTTLPISAASLPLPLGAATSALQTQPGVDIGDVTVNNASGGSAVNIQDGGNIITVDGTVVANGGGTAGTANSGVITVQGIASMTPVQIGDNSGSITVDQPTGSNLHVVTDSGTITTVSTVTNLSQQGGVAISLNTGVRDSGTQRVTIATNDSVPVTFTNSTDVATQTTLASALTSLQLLDNAVSGSGYNITQMNGEAIDVGAGTEAAALRVTLPTNGTGVLAGVTTVTTVTTCSTLTGGGVAHDSADSGNPHKVGFKAYSPDGTTPGTAVAELDRSDAKCDLDGMLYVSPSHPRNFSYHDDDVAAVTTDGTVAADPGDGFAVFITDIIFSIGAATASSIFLEEGTTKIMGPYYLEATAGRGVVIHLATPKRCTASTAILVTNTGSIVFSIDILGYVGAV